MDSSVTFSRQTALSRDLISKISCLSRLPPCNQASATAPQFVFVLLDIAFLTYASKMQLKHIAFPRSSKLYTVSASILVISLAGGF